MSASGFEVVMEPVCKVCRRRYNLCQIEILNDAIKSIFTVERKVCNLGQIHYTSVCISKMRFNDYIDNLLEFICTLDTLEGANSFDEDKLRQMIIRNSREGREAYKRHYLKKDNPWKLICAHCPTGKYEWEICRPTADS